VDVARVSAFVRAPLEPGLAGSITRANSQGEAASFFVLGAFVPIRSAFLIQTEIPYITVALKDEVEDGFGDAVLRAKARGWAGHRKALLFASSLRFGSGSAALFPYSTASTDLEAGAAFVDTVGTSDGERALQPLRSLSYWIVASGVYIIRIDDRLKEAGLHGHHATAGGGVLVALTRKIEVEVGGLALFFRSGAAREVYFSKLTATLSPATDLLVTIQGERGDWRERAVDASATVGLAVRY
jgi:hypothetical protein